MFGSICGDIIGSRFEFEPIKHMDFELFDPACRFTDDTVCTVAIADALMTARELEPVMVRWVRAYAHVGYGGHFLDWALSPVRRPYGSFGNGSAMRVGAVGWLANSIADAARIAAETAVLTHNHHHGVRGAKAVAVATRMALEGWTPQDISDVLEDRFGYDLHRTPDQIRPDYSFEFSCQKSVPEALICALQATSYEEAVRLAISLGGDADTQAAIAGGVAQALFGLPGHIQDEAMPFLSPRMQGVVMAFRAQMDGRTFPHSDPKALTMDRAPSVHLPDPKDFVRVEFEKLAEMEATTRVKPRVPLSVWHLLKDRIRKL